MDFLSLKYFITVAQTQHMTKAAQMLNITQPALSASIKRLETVLGCPLFERTGRGIELNEYGKIFLSYANAIDQSMTNCIEEIELEKQNKKRHVSIACSSASTNTQMLSMLLSQNIHVEARWIPRNWESELTNNNLDFVLTFGKSSYKNLDHVLLCNYRVIVVAGKNHPLAKLQHVSIDDLNTCQFCCNSAPHSLTHMVKTTMPCPDFLPRITFQGRDVSDMIRMIKQGHYLGLMIKEHLSDDAELITLPVDHFDIYQPFYLYWNRGNFNSFLSVVQQNIINFYEAVL